MKKHKGFTIVELLIVIVVISILAGITTVIYSGITARAYDSKKLAELTNLVKQLELYRHEHDCVPTRCPGENSRKSEDIIVYNSKSSPSSDWNNTTRTSISPKRFKDLYNIDIPLGFAYRSTSYIPSSGSALTIVMVRLKDRNNAPEKYRMLTSPNYLDSNSAHVINRSNKETMRRIGVTYDHSKRAFMCNDGSIGLQLPDKFNRPEYLTNLSGVTDLYTSRGNSWSGLVLNFEESIHRVGSGVYYATAAYRVDRNNYICNKYTSYTGLIIHFPSTIYSLSTEQEQQAAVAVIGEW